MTASNLWTIIRDEVATLLATEPRMEPYFGKTVLAHECLISAISFHIAEKLANTSLPESLISSITTEALHDQSALVDAIQADLTATVDRDPACDTYSHAYLYSKGFLALQTMRIANWLWKRGDKQMALLFENEVNMTYGVDIHPAARIGKGILVDHATGIVIGETATVGDNVSMLHGVTLGGTGKDHGDRHPKVGNGVLIARARNRARKYSHWRQRQNRRRFNGPHRRGSPHNSGRRTCPCRRQPRRRRTRPHHESMRPLHGPRTSRKINRNHRVFKGTAGTTKDSKRDTKILVP